MAKRKKATKKRVAKKSVGRKVARKTVRRKKAVKRNKRLSAKTVALVASLYGSSSSRKRKRKPAKRKAGGKRKVARKAGGKRKAAIGRCKSCKRAIFGGKKGMATHMRRSH
jgi:hypothetical protein